LVAALELYLDVDATRRIRTLWRALEADGIPSLGSLHQRHRPHVSLAAAHRIDPHEVAAALEGVPLGVGLPLRLDFAGQFVGRVLWLGVTVTPELLALHEAVHARLSERGIEIWDQYRPGRWVPHCTISMRVPNPQMAQAVRRCLEILPVSASVTGAAVADHINDVFHPL
jgi:2'-5' RNA ligase